jgi:hypothetical protein
MRILLATLGVLLAVTSGSASAEWVKIGEDKKMTLYLDPSTIKASNNLRKVWTLLDRKDIPEYGGLSVRSHKQYNCKTDEMTILSFSFHSEHMALGNVISAHTPSDNLINVPPNTPESAALKFVCSKVGGKRSDNLSK